MQGSGDDPLHQLAPPPESARRGGKSRELLARAEARLRASAAQLQVNDMRGQAVAMVGFDDFPLADMLRPGVTVVAQDIATMGRLAAETLFRRLDGDQSPARTDVVPTRLIPRGSGEIPVTAARRG